MEDFLTSEQRMALCTEPECVVHTPDGDAFCPVPRTLDDLRDLMDPEPIYPITAQRLQERAEALTATAEVIYTCGCKNVCECAEGAP